MQVQSILQKFAIDALNPMQEKAGEAVRSGQDVVLLSPTGTGKTLAFLLPIVAQLDPDSSEIQTLILVPTRELAQQIEQVARRMGSGFKVNAVYGGRSGTLDKIDLRHRPAILIGTPGRIADRFRRDDYSLQSIQTLVLDEFDKSLEIGFEKEMEEIVSALPSVKQRVLTSATTEAQVPSFLGLVHPITLDYLGQGRSKLTIKTLVSPEKDKLSSLVKALAHLGSKPGIVFLNFKDGLQRVSDHLAKAKIKHVCFHGSMEQRDREQALVKFRNGTTNLLLATDLAARGLDIPELAFILHYHLPPREKEFTHRNGRTARMQREGVAYLLIWEEELLPDYLQELYVEHLDVDALESAESSKSSNWATLYISGGRRDKISKGDVAGFLMKQGQVDKTHIGIIEVQQSCAYAAVRVETLQSTISKTNNMRLKKKKVRVSLL